MSRAAAPFAPRVVLGLLLVGTGALLLFLYAIGAGWDGRSERDGGAHAAANGLNGYAALAALLERRGHEVALSRSRAGLDEPALLVLTPPHFADGEALAELLVERRWQGPTLLILPKWFAAPLPETPLEDRPDGWVELSEAAPPGWLEELDALAALEAEIGEARGWRGLGGAGALPRPDEVQMLNSSAQEDALVTTPGGAVLAGFILRRNEENGGDWPLLIVAEPDLLNNIALADPGRAVLAVGLVEEAMDGETLPIIFDLTLPGLGAAENLLTLAFRPPFLAATLCLILAAIVVGWRAFRRFGPATAALPAHGATGKRQLARQGAALVVRARRWHLLGPPYAALITRRIADRLGLREADEVAMTRLIAARGAEDDFPTRMQALRQARTPRELVEAARALTRIERSLAR